MEQYRKGLQLAHKARSELGAARAMELQAKHPQLNEYDNEVQDNSPAIYGSGNDAGLARVVGKGRHKKGSSNGVMMDGMGHCKDESESDSEMAGGARHGKMFAKELMETHGAGWLTSFAKGLLSGVKSIGDVVSNIPGPVGMIGSLAKGAIEHGERQGEEAAARVPEVYKRGRGRPRKLHGGNNQVIHALQSPAKVGLPGSGTGGQDVPPNGVPAFAYGNPPQAPASFQRNTVGMGKLVITHGGAGSAGGAMKHKRKPSARNMMISKLVKEEGMSLPEASRYLKEHPQ